MKGRKRLRHSTMRCPKHPHAKVRCPACIGQKGGRSRSKRKVAAVRKTVKIARRKWAAMH